MNTKSLEKIKAAISNVNVRKFNLDYEAEMVQARILSPFYEIIEDNNISQVELEKLTGIKQSFLSGLFGGSRKLSMKHIALLQKGLEIVMQPPKYLSLIDHNTEHYTDSTNLLLDEVHLCVTNTGREAYFLYSDSKTPKQKKKGRIIPVNQEIEFHTVTSESI